MGDGLATMISGSLGGTGVTTYAEKHRCHEHYQEFFVADARDRRCIRQSVSGYRPNSARSSARFPVPILGGLAFVLFGLITRQLPDESGRSAMSIFTKSKNLLVAGITMVMGAGGSNLAVRQCRVWRHRHRHVHRTHFVSHRQSGEDAARADDAGRKNNQIGGQRWATIRHRHSKPSGSGLSLGPSQCRRVCRASRECFAIDRGRDRSIESGEKASCFLSPVSSASSPSLGFPTNGPIRRRPFFVFISGTLFMMLFYIVVGSSDVIAGAAPRPGYVVPPELLRPGFRICL